MCVCVFADGEHLLKLLLTAPSETRLRLRFLMRRLPRPSLSAVLEVVRGEGDTSV